MGAPLIRKHDMLGSHSSVAWVARSIAAIWLVVHFTAPEQASLVIGPQVSAAARHLLVSSLTASEPVDHGDARESEEGDEGSYAYAYHVTQERRRRLQQRWTPRAARRLSSQGEQDKRLTKLLTVIGEGAKEFVEFGYKHEQGSNTQGLRARGWRGLLLDGKNSDASINLHAVHITSENIVPTFKTHGVSRGVDYLSVDIDSFDLWVLRAILASYRPRLVTVEYRAEARTVRRRAHGFLFGASVTSATPLPGITPTSPTTRWPSPTRAPWMCPSHSIA